MAEGIRKKGATYSYRVNVKNPETGNWKTIEKCGFATVAEAKAARSVKLAEIVDCPESILVKDKNVTFGEVYREYIEKYATFDREKSTLRRYDSLYRNHLIKWEYRKMGDIKANELTEYLYAMTATHAHSYIMGLHKFMKVLWLQAEKLKYIKTNIFDQVETPKPDSSDDFIDKIYTVEQLDTFEKRFSSTNLLTAYKMGRSLGVRLAECFGLRWTDVDFEKRTISVRRQMVWEDGMWCLRNTKTKAAIRSIDLQDDIYEHLKNLKITQEQQRTQLGVAWRPTRVAIDNGRNKAKTIEDNPDLINLKGSGEYLTPDSCKVLGRISRAEMDVDFKYHNLRHTHASLLAEKNIPEIVVKQRLGHSKIETTMKYYQHITDGMRSDLMGKLNAM